MTTDQATRHSETTVDPAAAAAARRVAAWLSSEAVRQAIRIALAMAIAYYVSLSMGWDRPHWAGLAVAMCSLATVGESLNKGLLRILGTFLAGIVALLLIALFPQERWPFLLIATTFMAFCTYMMSHSSRWYFWFIAGYVMPLLALFGGPEGASSFETVVLRLKQTSLGVVVYTLVARLLWPRHTTGELARSAGELVDMQRRLLADQFAALAGRSDGDVDLSKLRAGASAAVAGLPAIMDGAELDSAEIWQSRRLWRCFIRDVAALQEVLERWRQGFPELRSLSLERRLPGLPALVSELDARLTAVAQMLAGETPRRGPREAELGFAASALDELTRFDRAALVRARDLLQRTDRMTRRLVDTVAEIRGLSAAEPVERPDPGPGAPWSIDLDRLASSVRTFTAVWLILLAVLYVPEFPMPAGVIPVAAALGIMLALFPELPVRSLVKPVLGSIAFAGAFHVLLMPHLSSFLGLGTGIFLGIFLICVVFARPEQSMTQTLAMSTFVMVIQVGDEQHYSVTYVMNFALMWMAGLSACAVSAWFPISFRPDRVVFKQIRRFLASCDRLIETRTQDARHHSGRMRHALDLHEVAVLPGRIARWFRALPATAYGGATPAQAGELANRLQTLGDRVRELAALRGAPQSALLVKELTPDMRAWRDSIQAVLRQLAADPERVETAPLRAGLDATLGALEARIEGLLNGVPDGAVSAEELENMYRLLGAYRGVSEAVLDAARLAAPIDWGRLREGRF